MGVKGLWKIVSSYGKKEDPKDCVLAIDTSIWVHQYKGMHEIDAIYWLSKRIIKLLYYDIRPIFVFDGPPSHFKKKVIDERKKERLSGLYRDIIDNKTCRICKTKIRTCKHGGLLLQSTDNVIVPKQEWGDVVNETTSRLNNIDDVECFIHSDRYTTKQKLKMLVKLREKRKERLDIDEQSILGFSKSQIRNIRQRNKVSYHIRQLEKEGHKRISSDSTKTFLYTKNESDVCDKKVAQHGKPIEVESDDELNDLLDITCDTTYRVNVEGESLKDIHSYDERDTYVHTQHGDVKLHNAVVANRDTSLAGTATVTIKTSDAAAPSYGFFNNNGVEEPDDIREEVQDKKLVFDNSRNNITVTQKADGESMDVLSIQTIIKKILNVLNIQYIDSPAESDAQCAFFYKSGIVDGVVTEDNDILLHGGVIYKNFFRKDEYIMRYDPKDIVQGLGIAQADLINLGYVLGSDYTTGIKGIGAKKALEYIKSKEICELDVHLYTKIYTEPIVDREWRPVFGVITAGRFLDFCQKHGVTDERINELKFYLTKKCTERGSNT